MNRTALEQQSKIRLAVMARALGWRGDDARHTKEQLVDIVLGLQPANGDAPAGDFAAAQADAAAVVEHAAPVVAAPAVHVPQPAAGGDAAAQLAALIAKMAGGAMDENRVRAIAAEVTAEAIARGAAIPREIIVKGPDVAHNIGAEIVNPVFDKVVKLAAQGVNVLLKGPAGCGKTHLGHQVARALGKTFASISGSSGVTEAHLTGRLLPGEGGRFTYYPAPFVIQYAKDDGAFMFDELDAFDSNCLLTVNQATANGGFEIEARAAGGLDTYVKRGERVILMGTMNTFGTGADAQYVGRNPMDAATLDRWYVIQMDYCAELESALIGADPADVKLGAWVLQLRQRANDAKLRRIVSTRTLQKALTARRAGIPVAEIKADTLAGWTADECRKVGE